MTKSQDEHLWPLVRDAQRDTCTRCWGLLDPLMGHDVIVTPGALDGRIEVHPTRELIHS